MKRRTFFKGASAASLLAAGTLISNTQLHAADADGESGPFHYSKSLESCRQMPGFTMNFVVDKSQTNGAYSIIEAKARKGGEPGLHYHEHEDEAFFMLEGEMMVVIGEKEYHVKPGDYIFLPRMIPHTQKFITETIHTILMISPAGLEEYFRAATLPAENFEIPPLSNEPPSEEMMQMMMKMNEQFGIKMLG